jgi:hypothetical protein
MIEKQVHRKFGFIKIKQLEKVKVKQQLHMKMMKQHKRLLIGIMVSIFSKKFDGNYLFKIGKEVLSNIVQISLATRRASAFGGRGGHRGRGGGRGRGKKQNYS